MAFSSPASGYHWHPKGPSVGWVLALTHTDALSCPNVPERAMLLKYLAVGDVIQQQIRALGKYSKLKYWE